jgi:hypothetical protein
MRTTTRRQNVSHGLFFLGKLRLAPLAPLAVLSALISGCAKDGIQSAAQPHVRMPESQLAIGVVNRIQSRFVMKPNEITKRLLGPVGNAGVLAAPVMDKAEVTGSGILPHFPTGKSLATVKYPFDATAPFSLTHVKSGATLSVALTSAVTSPAESAGGYVVYRNALPGADVTHRPSQYGTEDLIVFEKAPAKPSVSYSVTLPSGVAGLRLFSNVLEFLDNEGTPLFHVAPPLLVDSASHVTTATLSVAGCKVDSSDQPSWHRTPIAPGALSCVVAINWDRANVSYPAALDPSWTIGATMSVPRMTFASAVIANGSPLIIAAGGHTALDSDGLSLYTATTDFFDVTSGTWSLGPSLVTAVDATVAVYNPGTNEVLLPGGSACGRNVETQAFNCVNYPLTQLLSKNPTTGAWVWTSSAPMRSGRSAHTATLLSTGQVLLAGGYDNTTADWTHVTAACDLYDFTTHQLATQPPPDMHQPRAQFGANAVNNGQAALVTGGFLLSAQKTWIDPPTAEIYLASTNQWVNVPDMPVAHTNQASVALSANSVLVIGGTDYHGFQNEADIFTFSPTAPYGAWTSAGNFATLGRGIAPAALLSKGAVLFASGWAATKPYGGGYDPGVYSTEADLYDPITGKWIQTTAESAAHFHGAAQSVTNQGSTTTIVFVSGA